MSWKDTLRKAPFEEDDYGQMQPTEDTHPEIVELFEAGLMRIKDRLDNQDIKYGEKMTELTHELSDLKSQKYQAFFLKRPFYNKNIKELEQEILRLNNLIQNRGLMNISERKFLASQLEYGVEWPKKMAAMDEKMNQAVNDMLVDLGKEPKGTDFQQDMV